MFSSNKLNAPTRLLLGAVCALALVGCEGGGTVGGQPMDENPGGFIGGTSATQQEALNKLGVDTSPTDRVDENGNTLPDDFSPMGSSCTVGQTDELFIVGIEALDDDAGAASTVRFSELADDDTGTLDYAVLKTAGAPPVWEADDHSTNSGFSAVSAGSQTLRAVTAGDVDGDGHDEAIIAFNDPDSASRSDAVQIAVVNDPADAKGDENAVVVHRLTGILDIDAVACDFDGDGDADVAVAASTGADVTVVWVERTDDGSFRNVGVQTSPYQPSGPSYVFSTELAAGNLDNDGAEELAVVANIYETNSQTGIAYLSVYDDAKAAFATLMDKDPVIYTNGQTYVFQVADVALGDIDADARDEIVLGGLTGFYQDPCKTYGHVCIALEDAADADAPLEQIGGSFYTHSYIPSGCETNSDTLRIRKVHVNTFDVDGDNVDEIQANLVVFEDFAHAAPFTELFNVPNTEIYTTNIDAGGTFGDTTSTMVTGDVTGDGRDDLIMFTQWRHEISVWSLNGPGLDTAVWEEVLSIETESYNGQARVFPLMAACNIDDDGMALRYSDSEYRFVYTEPIIIAAVAAAPCQSGIGQNTDACTTTYGESSSNSNGVDGSVSVSASAFVAFEAKDPFFGIGVGGRSSVTSTSSFTAELSYELTESVEYTTGPMEDTVIFTSVPLDQYTYTITSHPDPELIGEKVIVNLPRSPVTLQVPRTYFNESVVQGSMIVGTDVFKHSPGQLGTYPTEAEADSIIGTSGIGMKTSRPVSAPLGTGQVTTTIEFTQSTSYRAGEEISYETEVEASAVGVTVGMGVGSTVESGLSWGNSYSTIYSGTVGAIPPDQNAEYGYRFGLFTYIHNFGDPTKLQFEVINYWVE